MSNPATTPELEQRLEEIEERWKDNTSEFGDIPFLFSELRDALVAVKHLERMVQISGRSADEAHDSELKAFQQRDIALATVEKLEEHERQRIEVQQKGCVE
jgi:hypothetical protein